MAVTIGTFSAARLIGNFPVESLATDVLAEGGCDGYGLRTRELRARPGTFVGFQYYSTVSDAYVAIDSLHALRGTIVSVTDEMGQSFTGVAVVDARAPALNAINGRPNPCMVYTAAASKVMLYFECDLLLQNR